MSRILFVDDDPTMRSALQLMLKEHDLMTVESKVAALNSLNEGEFALLLTDLCMPDEESGLSLVEEARNRDEDLHIVVLTGFGSIDTAVEAMRRGADDYLTKDFSPDDFRLRIDRLLGERRRKLKVKRLEAEHRILHEAAFPFRRLLGESPPMLEVKRRIQAVAADSESSVLITGNSGTGKELVAREIHERSPRRTHRYVPIDCPTIPPELFESELFGHEKGAFTHAASRKLGRIELADKGTLLMDEIGDLPMRVQAKLLRFLETSQFNRLGSTRQQEVDVRFLFSTNQDLMRLVAEKRFRRDLFYRLNVIVIDLPDLRDRPEDIELLAQSFLEEFNRRKGKQRVLTDIQLRALRAQPWPGNVRELRHVIESYSILGELTMPQPETHPRFDMPYKEAKRVLLDEFEARYFRFHLNRHAGHISKTAQAIGISREELSRKLKRLGVEKLK